MLIRKSLDIRSSEITSEEVFRTRRMWLQAAAVGGFLSATSGVAMTQVTQQTSGLANPPRPASFAQAKKSSFSATDKPNSLEEITHYNNFTEFGGDKSQPASNAQKLSVRPWTVTLDGLVKKPKTLDIENILANFPVEERIYRLRCVEAWSMVIPWLGIPLVEILKQVEPLGSAKYVQFTSLYDPKIMAGAGVSYLEWPYREGLRLDEARHPLSLLVVGLYGEVLPRQNGAPLRLAVPWKYGFKGAKSIVKITFTEKQPTTTWNLAQPNEYGFYANVNPDVDHPRWSQAKERRIGQLMRYPTSMFNGYASQVASLYSGMDLKKNY